MVQLSGRNSLRDIVENISAQAHHLKEKLRGHEAQLVEQRDGVCRYLFDEALLDQLHATLSSYLGHFKLANTRNLWRGIWRKYPFLPVYFGWDEVSNGINRPGRRRAA